MLPVLLIVYYFMSYHDHLYKFEVIFVVVVGSILVNIYFLIQNLLTGTLCGYLLSRQSLFKYRFLVIPLISIIMGLLSFWIITPDAFEIWRSKSDLVNIIVNGLLFIILYYVALLSKIPRSVLP